MGRQGEILDRRSLCSNMFREEAGISATTASPASSSLALDGGAGICALQIRDGRAFVPICAHLRMFEQVNGR